MKVSWLEATEDFLNLCITGAEGTQYAQFSGKQVLMTAVVKRMDDSARPGRVLWSEGETSKCKTIADDMIQIDSGHLEPRDKVVIIAASVLWSKPVHVPDFIPVTAFCSHLQLGTILSLSLFVS